MENTKNTKNTTKATKKVETLKNIETLNNELNSSLDKIKVNEKFYDIAKCTQLAPVTKRTPVENYIYSYLMEKAKKNGTNICLQCKDLMLNTSYVFVKNTSKNFNDKNIFTVETIARVIRTLGAKNSIFLGLKATKKQNDFNIVNVANTKEEFEKFYGITKKVSKPKNETKATKGAKESDENIESVASEEDTINKELLDYVVHLKKIISEKSLDMKARFEKVEFEVNSKLDELTKKTN